MASLEPSLFGAAVPAGFSYQSDFISPDEEADLVTAISGIEFANFEMRGVVARRRVAFFGRTYDPSMVAEPALPDFLLPLRSRIAEWAGVPREAFDMALINEYSEGAPIGWHRDAPPYGVVAGVSLLSSCPMRFRPYALPSRAPGQPRRTTTHEVLLERRSAYLMTGESRSGYEHHIPPVKAFRYSITFRTPRR